MLHIMGWIQNLAWRALAVLPLPLLVACVGFRPTREPIEYQMFPAAQAESADTMLVMLPGIRDTEKHFIKHGFIDALRERGIVVDIAAVDAHLGYYRKEILDTRILEDVVGPARNRGVERFVFVGTSLGGLGSLVMARRHPDLVGGLILIAPYAGDKSVINEIRNAGGPGTWTPGDIDPDDFARDLWAWLGDAQLPPTVVACGDDDRLIETSRMLAELLPPDQLVTLPGGHDWKTWRKLWVRLLNGNELRESGILQ
jgi:pimeloyl-ACP methyl ester carboxylesterase